jgi:hypothetical protein
LRKVVVEEELDQETSNEFERIAVQQLDMVD